MKEEPNNHSLSLGNIELNTDSRMLFVDQQEVHITPIEYEIMLLLLTHPGRVFTRQEFIDTCWPDEAWVGERTVDVNIGRLRKKLGQACLSIKSRIGFGYMLSIR